MPAGTPVFISHVSADKAWALVETSFTYGWMPVEDFARVNEDFVKTWESGRYAVILRDSTSVLDRNGRFLVKASVGHLFPFTATQDGKMQISVAAADQNHQAVIRQGVVPAEAAAAKPLRFTPANAARIANEMIGEPYGWGGLYGNRDCSAMTRDFFTVFGIWLPRHSEDQVKEAGATIDLQACRPKRRKESSWKRRPVPEPAVAQGSRDAVHRRFERPGAHLPQYLGHPDKRSAGA